MSHTTGRKHRPIFAFWRRHTKSRENVTPADHVTTSHDVRSKSSFAADGDVIFRRASSDNNILSADNFLVSHSPEPSRVSRQAPGKPPRRKKDSDGSVGGGRPLSFVESGVVDMAPGQGSMSAWRSEEHLTVRSIEDYRGEEFGRRPPGGAPSSPSGAMSKSIDVLAVGAEAHRAVERAATTGDLDERGRGPHMASPSATLVPPPRTKKRKAPPVPPLATSAGSSVSGLDGSADEQLAPTIDVTVARTRRGPCLFIAPPPPDTPPPALTGTEVSAFQTMMAVSKVDLSTQVTLTRRDSLASVTSSLRADSDTNCVCDDDELSLPDDVTANCDDVIANQHVLLTGGAPVSQLALSTAGEDVTSTRCPSGPEPSDDAANDIASRCHSVAVTSRSPSSRPLLNDVSSLSTNNSSSSDDSGLRTGSVDADTEPEVTERRHLDTVDQSLIDVEMSFDEALRAAESLTTVSPTGGFDVDDVAPKGTETGNKRTGPVVDEGSIKSEDCHSEVGMFSTRVEPEGACSSDVDFQDVDRLLSADQSSSIGAVDNEDGLIQTERWTSDKNCELTVDRSSLRSPESNRKSSSPVAGTTVIYITASSYQATSVAGNDDDVTSLSVRRSSVDSSDDEEQFGIVVPLPKRKDQSTAPSDAPVVVATRPEPVETSRDLDSESLSSMASVALSSEGVVKNSRSSSFSSAAQPPDEQICGTSGTPGGRSDDGNVPEVDDDDAQFVVVPPPVRRLDRGRSPVDVRCPPDDEASSNEVIVTFQVAGVAADATSTPPVATRHPDIPDVDVTSPDDSLDHHGGGPVSRVEVRTRSRTPQTVDVTMAPYRETLGVPACEKRLSTDQLDDSFKAIIDDHIEKFLDSFDVRKMSKELRAVDTSDDDDVEEAEDASDEDDDGLSTGTDRLNLSTDSEGGRFYYAMSPRTMRRERVPVHRSDSESEGRSSKSVPGLERQSTPSSERHVTVLVVGGDSDDDVEVVERTMTSASLPVTAHGVNKSMPEAGHSTVVNISNKSSPTLDHRSSPTHVGDVVQTTDTSSSSSSSAVVDGQTRQSSCRSATEAPSKNGITESDQRRPAEGMAPDGSATRRKIVPEEMRVDGGQIESAVVDAQTRQLSSRSLTDVPSKNDITHSDQRRPSDHRPHQRRPAEGTAPDGSATRRKIVPEEIPVDGGQIESAVVDGQTRQLSCRPTTDAPSKNDISESDQRRPSDHRPHQRRPAVAQGTAPDGSATQRTLRKVVPDEMSVDCGQIVSAVVDGQTHQSSSSSTTEAPSKNDITESDQRRPSDHRPHRQRATDAQETAPDGLTTRRKIVPEQIPVDDTEIERSTDGRRGQTASTTLPRPQRPSHRADEQSASSIDEVDGEQRRRRGNVEQADNRQRQETTSSPDLRLPKSRTSVRSSSKHVKDVVGSDDQPDHDRRLPPSNTTASPRRTEDKLCPLAPSDGDVIFVVKQQHSDTSPNTEQRHSTEQRLSDQKQPRRDDNDEEARRRKDRIDSDARASRTAVQSKHVRGSAVDVVPTVETSSSVIDGHRRHSSNSKISGTVDSDRRRPSTPTDAPGAPHPVQRGSIVVRSARPVGPDVDFSGDEDSARKRSVLLTATGVRSEAPPAQRTNAEELPVESEDGDRPGRRRWNDEARRRKDSAASIDSDVRPRPIPAAAAADDGDDVIRPDAASVDDEVSSPIKLISASEMARRFEQMATSSRTTSTTSNTLIKRDSIDATGKRRQSRRDPSMDVGDVEAASTSKARASSTTNGLTSGRIVVSAVASSTRGAQPSVVQTPSEVTVSFRSPVGGSSARPPSSSSPAQRPSPSSTRDGHSGGPNDAVTSSSVRPSTQKSSTKHTSAPSSGLQFVHKPRQVVLVQMPDDSEKTSSSTTTKTATVMPAVAAASRGHTASVTSSSTTSPPPSGPDIRSTSRQSGADSPTDRPSVDRYHVTRSVGSLSRSTRKHSSGDEVEDQHPHQHGLQLQDGDAKESEEFAATLARLKANLRSNSTKSSSVSMRFRAESSVAGK